VPWDAPLPCLAVGPTNSLPAEELGRMSCAASDREGVRGKPGSCCAAELNSSDGRWVAAQKTEFQVYLPCSGNRCDQEQGRAPSEQHSFSNK